MRRGWMAMVAVAAIVTACGGGVTEAEHDQVLAELALTQQELTDAKRQLAQSSASGQTESERADDLLARIDQIVRDNNIVLGAQQDPLEELGRLIADFHEREQALMEEMEAVLSAAERVEIEAPPVMVAGAPIEVYLELAGTTNNWLSQTELPAWQDISVAANFVEDAADPELVATWEELAGSYDQQSSEAQRTWLGMLGELSLQRIGEALVP